MVETAVIYIVAILIVVWVVSLVRLNKLYVGYGVIFVIAFALGVVALTFPFVGKPLASFADIVARSIWLVGLVLAFIVLLLIYILSQLTILSNRLTTLVQTLAVMNARSTTPAERAEAASHEAKDS